MTITNVSWFRTIIDNIKNDVDVETKLSELKVALTALNDSQMKLLAPNLQVDVIFDSLNSSNRNQVQSCCEILNVILPALPVSGVLSKFKASLNRALCHPQSEVKEAILLELIHCISSPALISELHNDPSLLKNVISCLCDEELSVANKAITFFVKLGKIPEGLTIICHPSIKQNLIEAIGCNDLYKIRLYQVVIDISVHSYEALKKVEKEGFVEGLHNQLSSNDVLARMALIEELTKLAITTHGFEFMRSRKIMDLMVHQLETFEDDPLSSILTPGLLKFFGSIGQKYPSELLNAYPVILRTIFKASLSEDLPVSISALETVGFIATSPVGKSQLKLQGEKNMIEVIEKMNCAMKSLTDEWKVRTFNAFANVLHLEDCSAGNELSELTKSWFRHLGSGLMAYILQMVQQPFPDLKLAAMQVILELAQHSWGQEELRNCQGLMDYLLDRTNETSLEGMQAKYNIISVIVESPTGSETFREIEYWRLKEFVRQGPSYAPTLPEVAFEGQPN